MSDEQPASQDKSLVINQLIAEYMGRTDSGEALSPDEFIAAHPDHAEELRQHFDNIELLDGLQQTDGQQDLETQPDAGNGGKAKQVDPDQTITRGGTDSETSVTRDFERRDTEKTEVAIPEQFGRYAIKKVLGQGAMGAVYLARDTQLDRDVALKIPKFGDGNNVDDEELLERFYREARASATLRSLNICPVYDVGEIDGQHYITMAFIEGRPLKDFTKSKKKHSEKQIATTIRKLALGLAEAHSIGVIHRDLKPANIMVDLKGEPVVMDFGLARRSASDDVQVTQSGAILGTPAYMAPEQVAGDQAAINHQVDIYALGVIMYELITGEMPFKGNLMAILQQIALNNPTKPSELRDNLDPRLEKICLKLMAGDQKKRYQSMNDVAADLQDVIKHPNRKQKKEAAQKTDPKPKAIPTAHEESNPALISVEQPKSYAEQLRKKKSKSSSKSPKSSTRLPVTSPADSGGNNKKYLIAGGLGGLILLLGIIFLVRVGKYDVQITLDDPSITLSVDGEVLNIKDGQDVYKLSAGEHKLQLQKDGLKTHVEEFTVSKDGKTALRATIVNNNLEALLNGEKPPSSALSADTQKKLAAIDKGLKRGLVGHWNFEEGQGTKVWDSSGQGNHGTLLEMEPDAWCDETPPSNFAGKRSLQFHNKTRVEIRDSDSLDIKDEITIAFWAKLDNSDGAFVDKGYSKAFALSGTPSRFRWQIAMPQAPNGDRPVHDDYVKFDDTSGKWAHFTVRYDSRKISWFLNGKLVKSSPYRGLLQESNQPLYLGNGDEGIRPADGFLDDIRIYHRSLTDEEIRRLANVSETDTGFGNWNAEQMNGAEGSQSPMSPGLNFPASSFGENKASSSISAPPGFSLYFDGTQEVGASFEGKFKHKDADNPLSQLTIEGEFFIPASPRKGDSNSVLVGLGNHNAGGSQMQGITQWQETLGVWSRGGARRGNVIFPANEPFHAAFVFDGQEARYYLNGTLEFSEADSRELRNAHLHLGTWRYNGWMKNVRFSSVARYKENYTPQPELKVDDQTFGYYKCDEGSGYVLNDSSKYNQHLFIDGAKWVSNSKAILPKDTVSSMGFSWNDDAPAFAVAPFNEKLAQQHQKAWAAYLGIPVEKVVKLTNGQEIRFMLIPPGEFTMGCSDEENNLVLEQSEKDQGDSISFRKYFSASSPQHRIRITRPFYLSRTELTKSQFNLTDSSASDSDRTIPATDISWEKAVEYCDQLSRQLNERFRLPTEAEWEYACRAGTVTAFSFGDSLTSHQANFDGNFPFGTSGKGPFLKGPAPVGSYPANPFGLHDMHGNQWEWCQDFFASDYYQNSPVNDPQGPKVSEGQHVLRGGDWEFSHAISTRSGLRYEYPNGYKSIGMRPVMEIEVQKFSRQQSSLEFDGEKSYVGIPSLKYEGVPAAWTFEALVTPLAEANHGFIVFGVGNEMNVAARADIVEPKQCWQASLHPDIHLFQFEPYWKAGEQSHLACVIQDRTFSFFVNGKLIDQSPISDETLFEGTPFLGNFSPLYPGKGQISEVRISNTARYIGNFTPPQRHHTDADTVVLYHFDEGSGDILNDSSGNGHDGKIIGAKWMRSDGEVDRGADQSLGSTPSTAGLYFEGLGNPNEMVTAPIASGTTLNELTLEAWLTSEVNDGHGITILGFGAIADIQLYQDGNRRTWTFSTADGSENSRVACENNFDQVDRPIHIAGVWDGKQRRIYVDGKLEHSSPWSGPLKKPTDHKLKIGFGSGRFKGVFHEIRISDIARYDQDFTPKHRLETDRNALALYHFDEGSGDALKDSSGNGHHGKIIGAKWMSAMTTSGGESGSRLTPANGPVDLVPFIDLEKDVTLGSFEKRAGRLLAKGVKHRTIQVPITVSGDYSFRTSFVQNPRQQHNMEFFFPVGDRTGIVQIKYGGFAKLDPVGVQHEYTPDTLVKTGENDVRIVVRQPTPESGHIEVDFNGTRILDWSGPIDSLEKNARFEVQSFAVYEEENPISMSLEMLSGRADFLRPDVRLPRSDQQKNMPDKADDTSRWPLEPTRPEDNAGLQQIETSLDFQTPGDRVTVPDLPVDLQKPFTIEAWLKADSKPESASPNRYLASIGPVILKLYQHKGGQFIQAGVSGFNTKINTWAGVAEGSPMPKQSEAPMHVAYVFDGEDFHLFVNGSDEQSHTELVGAPLLSDVQLKQYTLDLLKRNQNKMFEIGTSGSLPQNEDDNLRGQVHEVRISQSARYTARFQPQIRLPSEQDTIALYHFEEGSGDILKDSSGNGHHGKIVGAKWVNNENNRQTSKVRFDIEDALHFDGDDNILVDNVPWEKLGEFTFEAFVRADTSDETPGLQLVVNQLATAGLNRWNGNWTFSVQCEDGKTFPDSTTGIPTPAGRWDHLAGVYQDNQVQLFVNGEPMPPRMLPQPINPATKTGLQMGKGFIGSIAGVKISKVAKYEEAFTPPVTFTNDAETLALYLYNEGSGETLHDSSGNELHGIIIGAKWEGKISASRLSSPQPKPVSHLQFNGDSVVQFPDIKLNLEKEMTYELWVRCDAIGDRSRAINHHQLATLTNDGPWRFTVFTLKGGIPEGMALKNLKFPQIGQWEHIAGVVRQGEMELFVNGTSAGKRPLQEPREITQAGLAIGNNFEGAIRAVRISNVARYNKDFEPDHEFSLDENTIALYQFQEGAGDILHDSSGNQFHGNILKAEWKTDQLAITSKQPMRSTQPANAGNLDSKPSSLSLNTFSDRVAVPLDSIPELNPVTLEAWVRPKVAPPEGDDDQFIMSLRGSHQVKLETTDLGGVIAPRWEYKLKLDPSSASINPPRAVPLNEWSHLACVRDGAAMRMYVNGRLVGSNNREGILENDTGEFTIGFLSDVNQGFIGDLKEIRVSSIARYTDDFEPVERHSPDDQTILLFHCDEIRNGKLIDSSNHQRHGNMTISGLPTQESGNTIPGLVGYWNFDNVTGTSVPDQSENENNGALLGGDLPDAWSKDVPKTSATNRQSFNIGGERQIRIEPQGAFNTDSEFTLAFWCKIETEPQAEASLLHGYFHNDFQIFTIPGPGLRLLMPNQKMMIRKAVFKAGIDQWMHVAAVRDKSHTSLYINGVLAESEPTSSPVVDQLTPFVIGGDSNFKGKLDEVRIYHRALNLDELNLLAAQH